MAVSAVSFDCHSNKLTVLTYLLTLLLTTTKLTTYYLPSDELPAPLGRWAYIPDNSGVYEFIEGKMPGDFPFACSAGIVGDDLAKQSSPACGAPCPGGYWCGKATVVPTVCQRGKFCPEGSPAPLDCPGGTKGEREQLLLSDECTPCLEGTFAASGAGECTPCAKGTYAANSSSTTCSQCEDGKLQEQTGQDVCTVCPAGNACPRGSAAAAPCYPGTFSGKTGLTKTSECSYCPRGSYCPEGAISPTQCPAGTFGQTERLGEESGCTKCEPPTSSVPGSIECTSCEAGFYLLPSPNSSSIVCESCLAGASCPANTTIRTIVLGEGQWRLGPLSKDAFECMSSNDGFSPCIGGNGTGVDDKELSYCREGYVRVGISLTQPT